MKSVSNNMMMVYHSTLPVSLVCGRLLYSIGRMVDIPSNIPSNIPSLLNRQTLFQWFMLIKMKTEE